MKVPAINLIPLKAAVSSDSPTTLDVLVRIIPPTVEVELKRPTLNIGFVIDRSGSMHGQKIEYARQAACYAVQQLLPTDRVSVTIYDDQIETLVPSTLAVDKASIIRKIQGIHSRNMTALHAGWTEGGSVVAQHLNSEHLNRVILLSDGLANVGETNPDAIATDVHKLAQRGISTTTMGVGNDYDEKLLEAMANSGDGNYYYIESPQQLPDIFQTELQGLMATVGTTVSLGIEPQGGVELMEVLNELEVNRKGRYQLTNLVIGNPIEVVVRLRVPPMTQTADLCYFRLAWNDPQLSERQKLRVALQLPVVSSAQLQEFSANQEVQEQVVLMMAARAKKDAVRLVERGDYEAARRFLQETRELVLRTSNSPQMQQEAADLAQLEAELDSRQYTKFSKTSTSQSYYRHRSSSERHRQRHPQNIHNRIEVIEGDITQQKVDAIVNPTDESFSGNGDVDAAIHAIAGTELKEACRQLNGISTGEAKITNGYNLPARFVIHTVGPVWQGGNHGEGKMLARCYHNSLALAEQYSLRTVAFPSISTGAFGFPIELASQIAVREVSGFMMSNSSVEKVIFVCLEQSACQYYLDAIRRI
ncbi:macro domain-containing protein [Allocoleopsis sp.]|uniref:macro domain-containing protein n=1 Tax=Allocoleopsis sp. TaxID=3088169 RepID=UPI002FCF7EC3